MEGEGDVTRSIMDEILSLDIKRDEMEGEIGVTGSIIDELHSWDIQGDQMEGESGVTRSIIDEVVSWDMIKWKVKVVLFEISLMRFIHGISK